MINLSSELEKEQLNTFFTRRVKEYQQDLSNEGLNAQQYNILRGQIKELQELIALLNIHSN
ncbi:hypothetical protein [Histophilus somni]|nr:hypothetical protein [Histophilus somni]ARU64380.1 hypothetical protein BTV18_02105 [Histophilus somni]ARU66167.1 hypothetical protein BTV19_02100 [Histophilus somni]ARU68041.1 hypothetical protein BTV16_02105 [Histophilus somni]ARU69921.1 hypothetical protein BTV20_02105 [Histophilus somni]ARU71796.1 hypothetical protein BTV17_02100 [Histophilus somni]